MLDPLAEPADQEKALPELIKFLTDRRAMLAKLSKQDEEAYFGPQPTAPGPLQRTKAHDAPRANGGVERDGPQASFKELSQIIDTTLLKAYLLINSSLVGPLVRLENNCNVEEGVKLLRQYKVRRRAAAPAGGVRRRRLMVRPVVRSSSFFFTRPPQRYPELVEFYYGKGKHEEALQLLTQYVRARERGLDRAGCAYIARARWLASERRVGAGLASSRTRRCRAWRT